VQGLELSGEAMEADVDGTNALFLAATALFFSCPPFSSIPSSLSLSCCCSTLSFSSLEVSYHLY
jgi:hypothetical protein